MGIKNLKKTMKACLREKRIEHYSGKRMGIDTFVWLHKGSVLGAEKFVRGENPRQYLTICEQLIDLLQRFNIVPVFVFDGQPLPAKANTNSQRREDRKKAKDAAHFYHNVGDLEAAAKFYSRSISITSEMIEDTLNMVQGKGVEWIVAPYEADAQLAYLSKIGYIDLVTTIDTDLIAFGVETILFDLDLHGAWGYEFQRSRLEETVGEYCFRGWTDNMILYFCMLSGCDYLHVKNLGAKKAYKLVKDCRDKTKIITRVRNMFNQPATFHTTFTVAELTFKHQRVFCPKKRWHMFLNELTAESRDFLETHGEKFLGEHLPDHISQPLADGFLNPQNLLMPYKSRSQPLTTSRRTNTATPALTTPCSIASSASPRPPSPSFNRKRMKPINFRNRDSIASYTSTEDESESDKENIPIKVLSQLRGPQSQFIPHYDSKSRYFKQNIIHQKILQAIYFQMRSFESSQNTLPRNLGFDTVLNKPNTTLADYMKLGIINKRPPMDYHRKKNSIPGAAKRSTPVVSAAPPAVKRPRRNKQSASMGKPSSSPQKEAFEDIKLEKTLLQVAEVKSQFYNEHYDNLSQFPTTDGPIVNRPSTSGGAGAVEKQTVTRIMKQLYIKNKVLEEHLSGAENAPAWESREQTMLAEIEELKAKNAEYESQLEEQNKAEGKETDLYIQFLQSLVKENIEDSKRMLRNYTDVRNMLEKFKLKKMGRNVNDLAQQLGEAVKMEQKLRNQEKKLYENRLDKWERKNCEYFVEKKKLQKELESLTEKQTDAK